MTICVPVVMSEAVAVIVAVAKFRETPTLTAISVTPFPVATLDHPNGIQT